jgi:hypothetical protein
VSEQPSDENLLIQSASQLEPSLPLQEPSLNHHIADQEAIAPTSTGNTNNAEVQEQTLKLEAQKINLEAQKFKLTEQKIKLEEFKKETIFLRKLKLIQQCLRGTGGIVMLITGIVFMTTDNMLGPYLMGIGAAAASTSVKETIESVRTLSTFNKQDR